MRDLESTYRSARANASCPDVALPLVFSSHDCHKRGLVTQQQPDLAAEHSSEKSCQDGVSAQRQSGELDMSGTQSGEMSSHGSIGAVGQGSSQPQEVQGCTVSDRCA